MAIVLTTLSSAIQENAPNNGFADIGEQILYTFQIRNTGPGDLTGIIFSNPNIVISPTFDGNLANGEIKTVTGLYTLQAADLDNGRVTVSQTASSGAISSNVSNDNENLTVRASLSVVKKALKIDNTNGNKLTGDAGDTIVYEIKVTNSSPRTAFDLTLRDLPGGIGPGDAVTVTGLTDVPGDNDGNLPNDLAIGGVAIGEYEYIIQQSDIESSALNIPIINAANARGITKSGAPITGSNSIEVELGPQPDFTIVKTAGNIKDIADPGEFIDVNDNGVVDPNDRIKYTYLFTNTGNITLQNVVGFDDRGIPGGTEQSLVFSSTTLAPGQSATATDEAPVTQAFLDSGTLTNTVRASATPVGSLPLDFKTDQETVTVDLLPRIDVTKVANPTLINNAKVGDPVQYTYTMTNPGPVSLLNVNLVDDNGTPGITTDDVTFNAFGIFQGGLQISDFPGLIGGLTDIDGDTEVDDLAVGATTNAAYTAKLTQAAINAGFVTNIVVGKGNDFQGRIVTDETTATVTLTTPKLPELKLLKTAGKIQNNDCDPKPSLGDTITYTYEISNIGEGSAFNLILKDDNGTPDNLADDFVIPVQGLETLDGIGTLNDLGAGKTAVGYYTKTLTAEDICNCYFTNVGTVTGSSSTGQTVTASDDETIVFCPPKIHLEKCAELDLGADHLANPGDVIQYKFRVTNTGGIALNTIAIDDPFLQSKNVAINFAQDMTMLKPGESVDAFATYKITQADIDAGKVYNKATVYGNPFYGDPKTRNDDVTDCDDAFVCVPQHAKIHVDKVTVYGNQKGDGLHIPVDGDFYWEYKIVNQGNVSLRGVELSDHLAKNLSSRNIIDRGNNDDVLDVGETWTYRFVGKAQKGEQCSDGQFKASYKDCDGRQQYVHGKDWSSYTGKHPAPICPPDPCKPQKHSGALPQHVANQVVDYLKTWKHSNPQQWNGSTQQQIVDKLQEHFRGQQLHFSVSSYKSPLC
jgi:uncharacterized repeat protein (TIGR01451 family)